jgi:Zn-dependent M28 family amino/carboxypeptidase
MIPHVSLLDGSITIMSPTGPITRTPSDFYYHKLVNSLDATSFADIEPYLTNPYCPSGVYHLYQSPTGIPYIHHISSDSSTNLIHQHGNWVGATFDKSNSTYLGPHESLESIYETHPELFI